MAKQILVQYGDKTKIQQLTGCCQSTIRLALAGDDSTAQKIFIRDLAIDLMKNRKKYEKQ